MPRRSKNTQKFRHHTKNTSKFFSLRPVKIFKNLLHFIVKFTFLYLLLLIYENVFNESPNSRTQFNLDRILSIHQYNKQGRKTGRKKPVAGDRPGTGRAKKNRPGPARPRKKAGFRPVFLRRYFFAIFDLNL